MYELMNHNMVEEFCLNALLMFHESHYNQAPGLSTLAQIWSTPIKFWQQRAKLGLIDQWSIIQGFSVQKLRVSIEKFKFQTTFMDKGQILNFKRIVRASFWKLNDVTSQYSPSSQVTTTEERLNHTPWSLVILVILGHSQKTAARREPRTTDQAQDYNTHRRACRFFPFEVRSLQP